jgi:coenzyme F420-0:L-glutamate ligase / coenzyme F420-1:gamma-L-glutamate ligase
MDGEVAHEPVTPTLSCAAELSFRALAGLPNIAPGDDLAALIGRALELDGGRLHDCDVLVVTSKVVAKAEDRYVDLSRVEPSAEARALALEVGKDARFVEVVLWDSERISRRARDVLIVRHHGGHVSANAGVDQSNARPGHATSESGPWLLRLPADADVSAAGLRDRLERRFGVTLGIVISDSFGRPFRQGSVGAAIGSAGLPALYDQAGRLDLDGRPLEHTITATADQLAAAADLLCGQADEARALVLVRGLRFTPSSASNARSLCRPATGDLYL